MLTGRHRHTIRRRGEGEEQEREFKSCDFLSSSTPSHLVVYVDYIFVIFVSIKEGSGPCLFCGALVLAPEEENWVQKDSKKARKVREQLLKKYGVEVSERTLPPPPHHHIRH